MYLRFNGINYPSPLTAADMCVVCNTPSFERQIKSICLGREIRSDKLACAATVHTGWLSDGQEGSTGKGFWVGFQLFSSSSFHPLPLTFAPGPTGFLPNTINMHIRSILGSLCPPPRCEWVRDLSRVHSQLMLGYYHPPVTMDGCMDG